IEREGDAAGAQDQAVDGSVGGHRGPLFRGSYRLLRVAGRGRTERQNSASGCATMTSSSNTSPGAEPSSRPRASINDVAKHAGVSAQTVSRVANGQTNVRASTRERVRVSMQALGYRPNSAARILKSGRFRSIGFVTF